MGDLQLPGGCRATGDYGHTYFWQRLVYRELASYYGISPVDEMGRSRKIGEFQGWDYPANIWIVVHDSRYTPQFDFYSTEIFHEYTDWCRVSIIHPTPDSEWDIKYGYCVDYPPEPSCTGVLCISGWVRKLN